MDFNTDLLNALAKRGWRIIVWILPINIIFSVLLVFYILIATKLYTIDKITQLDDKVVEVLAFLIHNIFLSIIVGLIFYIVKGDSGDKVKKIRSKFYKYVRERAFNLFEYRYSTPANLDKDFIDLVSYHKLYVNGTSEYTISVDNLSYNDLIEIDSLYIVYKLNDKEKVLFSIWHTGNKISIAIAFEKKNLSTVFTGNNDKVFEEITKRYKDTLNISDAKDVSIQIRENYYWFDIVYEVTEELLINTMEQEDISRKIAHVITVGLPVAMFFMGYRTSK